MENGGGLISLHISADSCPDWPEMKKLTGGGWVSGVSTHGHFGQFTVNIWDRDHPVTSGMDDFETHGMSCTAIWTCSPGSTFS